MNKLMGKILKSNRETLGKTKHVGGDIPPQLHSFLCLYATAKGLGKAEAIREGLELWKTQVESEDALISMLVQNIQIEWNIQKSKRKSFSDFIHTLEDELKEKGLSFLLVTKITERINK